MLSVYNYTIFKRIGILYTYELHFVVDLQIL